MFTIHPLAEYFNHAQFKLSATALPAGARRRGVVDLTSLSLLRGEKPDGQPVPALFHVIDQIAIHNADGTPLDNVVLKLLGARTSGESDARYDQIQQLHFELESIAASPLSFVDAVVTIGGLAPSVVESDYTRAAAPTITSQALEFATKHSSGATIAARWEAMPGIQGIQGLPGVGTPGTPGYNPQTLFGVDPPTSAEGNNNDWFVQSNGGNTATIYLKQAGAWVVIVANLKGADGARGVNFRGAHETGAAYAIADVVNYGGNLWYALVSNTSVTPVEGTTWTLFLTKGADGTITGLTVSAPIVKTGSNLSLPSATSTQNGAMSSAHVQTLELLEDESGNATRVRDIPISTTPPIHDQVPAYDSPTNSIVWKTGGTNAGGSAGGSTNSEVQTFVFNNVPSSMELAFRVENTSTQSAIFRATDSLATIKSRAEELTGANTSTITGTLSASTDATTGETLYSGTLLLSYGGQLAYVDVPQMQIVAGEVQQLLVTNGDNGNYSVNGGANFALSTNESAVQSNVRATGGDWATAIAKGLSNTGVAGANAIQTLATNGSYAGGAIAISGPAGTQNITPGDSVASMQTKVETIYGAVAGSIPINATTNVAS